MRRRPTIWPGPIPGPAPRRRPSWSQCLAGHTAELRKAGTLPISPASEIERVSVVLDLDAHYLQGKLDELDPKEEITALPEPVREELIGGSAAWRDDYVVVKGCSEGTAVLQEAMEEAGDGDEVKTGFFARMEPRREDWALRMLRSAYVQKGAGKVDWKSLAGTAKTVLDGRALETVPIMEYILERTNRVLAKEELLRGRQPRH